MKEYIWNGEMDCGWEDLATYFSKTAGEFSERAIECSLQAPKDKVRELINENSMNRFLEVVAQITQDLPDSFYFSSEDMDNDVSGLKMKQWILLGSITEVMLQVFLTIYLDDYENTHWQQWEEFAGSEAKQAISKAIDNLVSEGTILSKHGKSLKKAVDKKINEHVTVHSIEKVMLDEIIQFYEKNDIFDKDEIAWLRSIQKNRNCIHAFMDREMGTWRDLQYGVRFVGYLMEVMMLQLPC